MDLPHATGIGQQGNDMNQQQAVSVWRKCQKLRINTCLASFAWCALCSLARGNEIGVPKKGMREFGGASYGDKSSR